jgi:hypothetical protein
VLTSYHDPIVAILAGLAAGVVLGTCFSTKTELKRRGLETSVDPMRRVSFREAARLILRGVIMSCALWSRC